MKSNTNTVPSQSQETFARPAEWATGLNDDSPNIHNLQNTFLKNKKRQDSRPSTLLTRRCFKKEIVAIEAQRRTPLPVKDLWLTTPLAPLRLGVWLRSPLLPI